ncbi:MAG: type II toxin-antitoxin system VapC family toxin [Pseudomonadota bacterium]|nr:type II toxin-antitoxin system VapC family toxin [Pseudomonadota bacterium]
MAALDTNLLVRFLIGDDAAQGAAAVNLIRSGVRSGNALFIPVTVALELEWVLRSTFGFDKEAVMEAIHGLLAAFELSFESEGALEAALAQYRQSTADFSDCLHVALARQADELPLWTFDEAASRLNGAKLLPV